MQQYFRNIQNAAFACFNGKSAIFLYILAFFYVIPILLTNVYYMDDYNRAVSGYGWEQDGRFFANAIMWILNLKYEFFKIKQTDFFPYTIILSSFIFVFSGTLLCNKLKISNEKTFSLVPLFALFSPFILENITYRYDSLIMSVSFLLVSLPFLSVENLKEFSLSSFVFLMLAWMTYQSTIAGYISLCCIFAIDCFLKKENKKAFTLLLTGGAIFVVSALCYRIMIKVLRVNISFGRSVSIFQKHNIINDFIYNLHNGLRFIGQNLDSRFYTATIPLMILCICTLFFIYRDFLRSKINLSNIFYVLFLVFIVFFCTLGLNVFIYSPPWWLRILISFPFVFLSLIVVCKNYIKLQYINFACAFLLLYIFGLCSTYASSLKQQNEFTNQILALANPYLLSSDHMKLIVDGEIPYAPQTEFAKTNYKIIGTLVDKYMRDGWYWGERRAGIYNIVEDVFIQGDEREKILSQKCIFKVSENNKFFTLRVKDDISIIDFKKYPCK